ncbi:MAG TPA: GTPase HflX [Candidatus Babeliales bacterium]|nr:GTPase HflX [Candidatus Babeliales bacterium]
MAKKAESLLIHLPRVLIIGVHAPYNRTKSIESYYEEFRNLVKTNGTIYKDELYIKLRSIDPARFFTKGKLQEMREYCEKNQIKELIISEQLSGIQERNLEDELDVTVFDRTRLILEIFEKSAHTAEGKLQVKIAMLNYQKTRLTGKGINLSQQAGIIGISGGPGETLKEKETRVINDIIIKYKRQLERLQQARHTQRKQRLINKVPHICIIGYTNAGKSTLLNTLTRSDVLAENKLFATLDTTTRELYIDKKKKGVISDTVGFIQQLPHHLINAFKSTLSELEYADILLQVIDASDPNWESHIAVVQTILNDLKVEKQMVYVFNKIDAGTDLDEAAWHKYQPHVAISAKTKEGVAPLIAFLSEWQPS